MNIAYDYSQGYLAALKSIQVAQDPAPVGATVEGELRKQPSDRASPAGALGGPASPSLTQTAEQARCDKHGTVLVRAGIESPWCWPCAEERRGRRGGRGEGQSSHSRPAVQIDRELAIRETQAARIKHQREELMRVREILGDIATHCQPPFISEKWQNYCRELASRAYNDIGDVASDVGAKDE